MGSRESLPRGVAHLWWQVPLTIVTWLVLFEFPYPPGTSLDSSWQQVLTDAWIHRRAFGSDFDFTYGPWGFLLSPESTRESFWIHVAFELGAKLLFAIAFVEIAGRLRLAFRVMFLAAVVVLGWPHNDPTEMAFVVVVSLAWLLPDTSRPPRIVLGGFVLAWLALMKVSLLVLASLSVATVVALAALQGRRQRAAGIAAIYLCALAILWLGAGQRLADAREFLFLASQLSLGYASAMYLAAAHHDPDGRLSGGHFDAGVAARLHSRRPSRLVLLRLLRVACHGAASPCAALGQHLLCHRRDRACGHGERLGGARIPDGLMESVFQN